MSKYWNVRKGRWEDRYPGKRSTYDRRVRARNTSYRGNISRYFPGSLPYKGEKKYFDFTRVMTYDGDNATWDAKIPNANATASPIYVNHPATPTTNRGLLLIPTGTSYNQRIGQKVFLASLHLRINLTQAAKTIISETERPNVAGNQIIFLCVIDHQANGTVPTLGDVLNEPTTTGANPTVDSELWFRRLDRVGRWTVLWWEVMTLKPDLAAPGVDGDVGGVVAYQYPRQLYPTIYKDFNLKGLTIEYSDNNDPTTAATICCNNIHLFVAARFDVNAGSRNCYNSINADINGRVRFRD